MVKLIGVGNKGMTPLLQFDEAILPEDAAKFVAFVYQSHLNGKGVNAKVECGRNIIDGSGNYSFHVQEQKSRDSIFEMIVGKKDYYLKFTCSDQGDLRKYSFNMSAFQNYVGKDIDRL